MKRGIQIRGLRKEYGHTVVLNHIDLDIDHGVFGLLGKNVPRYILKV